MKVLLFFMLLVQGVLVFGQKKLVCISIDDLPVVSYSISDTTFQKKLMDKLIRSLGTHNIPAIGFVNETKLYANGKVDPFQVTLLKSWVDHGLALGNHTYSHPDYNALSYDEFTRDILNGEIITKQLLTGKGTTKTYFRHPFLHVGNTKAKADSLQQFLVDHHYTVAPVTIDNEDYLFALAYQRARNKRDTILMKQIGHDFIKYIEQKVKYYERQSNALFGRTIHQILLLHASSLNSDYIEALAIMLKKNNYQFINMDQALEDRAYQTPVTVYGKWGISWIDRWALSLGKKGDFFKDEPATPDYINKLAE